MVMAWFDGYTWACKGEQGEDGVSIWHVSIGGFGGCVGPMCDGRYYALYRFAVSMDWVPLPAYLSLRAPLPPSFLHPMSF